MGIRITVNTLHIRRINPRRDLLKVAELIEVCFFSQMDQEGRDYIRQIRRAARDDRLLGWMPGSRESIASPLDGYVWEENDQIIGNLTLIPYRLPGEWRYLIANVAVHPDYRRRGIAHHLTSRALDHIRDHMASSAWLQVRDDNLAAIQLYLDLGFKERSRRTTWHSQGMVSPDQLIDPAINHTRRDGISIQPRSKADWEQQSTWLKRGYPPEVAWNLGIRPDRFKPDFFRNLFHWITDDQINHWTAFYQNRMIGTMTVEPQPRIGDQLWLGLDPDRENEAIQALLTYIRWRTPDRRSLWVNYPYNAGLNGFKAAGFEAHNTLIWMEVRF